MNEIKNNIITISGEPASGKSSVVKVLIKEYQSEGYRVHVISTGEIFRKKVKEEYLKIHPSKTNISLADIQEDKTFAEKLKEIDLNLDGEIERIGKEINSEERPDDVYIVDSRLAWSQIPESCAVRLTVDEEIAGRRVFNDSSRGSEDKYKSIEEAIEKTRQRKQNEIERFNERYGKDLPNPENYDLVVDTSYSNPKELAEIIMKGARLHKDNKKFPKFWPTQIHCLPLKDDER